jgi:transcription antitermination factor NusG
MPDPKAVDALGPRSPKPGADVHPAGLGETRMRSDQEGHGEPAPAQLFIAANGPWRIVRAVALAAGAVGMTAFVLSTSGVPSSLAEWARLAFHSLVAAFLAMLCSGLVCLFVLGPIYYEQGLKNGAPYLPGDSVRILVGRHAGRVATVYQIWPERGQVRVDLG